MIPAKKRPVSITVVGYLYIVTGAAGFAYHFNEITAQSALRYDGVWVELVRLTAIVCGAYLIRGRNWARNLTLAWMAYHVILSAFHSQMQLAVHSLFLVLLAWLLFRPTAIRYFQTGRG